MAGVKYLWVRDLHEGGVHGGRLVVERELLSWYVSVVKLNVGEEPVILGQPVSLARVKYLLCIQSFTTVTEC